MRKVKKYKIRVTHVACLVPTSWEPDLVGLDDQSEGVENFRDVGGHVFQQLPVRTGLLASGGVDVHVGTGDQVTQRVDHASGIDAICTEKRHASF